MPKIRTGILRVGKQARYALYIEAPDVLSIEEERDRFLGLIADYQWRMFVQPDWQRGRYKTSIIDLSTVERLSLDAALVTTAEYDRLVTSYSTFRPVIDDKDWRPEVRDLFEELGLQSLVRATIRTGTTTERASSIRFIPFVSGEHVDQHLARKLIDDMEAACGRNPERAYVYTALVEAIGNVRHHAYPEDGPSRAVPVVPKWWAAGAYDPATETLQFAVYDQGIGIPATLPRRPFWKSIVELCPVERTDADVIVGGIAYGRSRFESAQKLSLNVIPAQVPTGRGNGLWAICQLIPEHEGSVVRILSGRGEVTYRGHDDFDATNYQHPFCGTLIQWTIKLPRDTGNADESVRL